MIAACIDKMRTDGCGGCERRNACTSLFAGLFGPARAASRPAPAPARRPAGAPFLSFLSKVARSIEAKAADANAKVAAPARPVRAEVERRLEAMLEEGSVRIEEVARALGLSRQTLYRRLKAENATFEDILDTLRRRLALRFLTEAGLSVKETAYRLGFSDPAAFSRAFKRWTGNSPRSVRREAD